MAIFGWIGNKVLETGKGIKNNTSNAFGHMKKGRFLSAAKSGGRAMLGVGKIVAGTAVIGGAAALGGVAVGGVAVGGAVAAATALGLTGTAAVVTAGGATVAAGAAGAVGGAKISGNLLRIMAEAPTLDQDTSKKPISK